MYPGGADAGDAAHRVAAAAVGVFPLPRELNSHGVAVGVENVLLEFDCGGVDLLTLVVWRGEIDMRVVVNARGLKSHESW
jgi:hypothetical protein